MVGTVTSEHVTPRAKVIDMFTGEVVTQVDQACSFGVRLQSHQGLSLLIVTDSYTGENDDLFKAAADQ